MLSIFFGKYRGSEYIENPDLYFDNTYADDLISRELYERVQERFDSKVKREKRHFLLTQLAK